jgi:hypothetical protein
MWQGSFTDGHTKLARMRLLSAVVNLDRPFGIGNSVGAVPTHFVVQRNATLKLAARNYKTAQDDRSTLRPKP